jgi:hypothetical protein
MAGWNAITGARGIVAAFLMSALLQLGFVDMTVGLLLCAGVSATGVALFWRASRGDPLVAAGLPATVRAAVPVGTASATSTTIAAAPASAAVVIG